MDEDKREWFAHALQFINHPVCLVDCDNRFAWVNAAYERLVGYSEAELLGKTWMSVTEMSDVGGDLASVESIISGDKDTYTTAKKYISKSGHQIPVALTVWRFPSSGALVGFSVEAIPESSSARLEKIHADHVAELAQLSARVEQLEVIQNAVSKTLELLIKWMPVIGALAAAIAWVYTTFVAQ